jgi:hypothetical protein
MQTFIIGVTSENTPPIAFTNSMPEPLRTSRAGIG